MSNLATTTSFILPILGMDSDHCAVLIENALKDLSGIPSVKTEFNNRRVLLQAETTDSVHQAIQIIQKLGYEVTLLKRSIPVLEMTCAACAVSVESILKTLPGIIDASVNFASARVSVEYLPNMVSIQDMRKAVQAMGYDLLPENQEDETDTLEKLKIAQHKALKNKTIGAILLAVPVMIIGMFFMNMPYANEIMWLLTTPVLFIFGRHFFIHAWKRARHRSANMDTLVALSTGTAYLFSAVNMLFPEFWHQRGLHAHVYFEASAVVIAFILLGKLLEENAKANTAAAIKKLMGLQPKYSSILQSDGTWLSIPVEAIKKGDIILLKPGERVAVDGIVSEGHSFLDESMLSGEPIPVNKEKGTSIFAGSVNQKGSLQYQAEKLGSETMLAQIIQLVQDAQGSKAPVQKQVDKIAAVFVPVVVGIAVLTFILWLLLANQNGFSHGLMAMVTVLIIACPCALGLATPTAIMVGIGKGAENGILIRDAENLEKAAKISAVVLDKTGTLTEGKPTVTDVRWMEDSATFKSILHALETQSEHPLADAIIQHLGSIESVDLQHFESVTGKGVQATFQNHLFRAGSLSWYTENGGNMEEEVQKWTTEHQLRGETVIAFAKDSTLLAVFSIADPVKAHSKNAVDTLLNQHIDVFMLTGDQEKTAAHVAEMVGIKHFKAGVTPSEKSDFIINLKQQGHTVAMVGDGINDSAALAQADVSIAMGKGSDIAKEVAGMTLIGSDLMKIPAAIQLSKQVSATIKQNLFWAFIYNIIGIPLAAGVLFPINGFLLNPMIAGAAMALSSVSVVSNSLRLKMMK
jgi:Cu2+-exporting ATPase